MEPYIIALIASVCIASVASAMGLALFLWWNNNNKNNSDKQPAQPGNGGNGDTGTQPSKGPNKVPTPEPWSEDECAYAAFKTREYKNKKWVCPAGYTDTKINWTPGNGYVSSDSIVVNAKQCSPDERCVKTVQDYAKAHPPVPNKPPEKPTIEDVWRLGNTMRGCDEKGSWGKDAQCKEVELFRDPCKKDLQVGIFDSWRPAAEYHKCVARQLGIVYKKQPPVPIDPNAGIAP